MSRISPSDPPTANQLAAQRAEHFAQDGNALLTVEATRTWLDRVGLALYAPRPDQGTVPAPSFVEATIGAATKEPTPEQLAEARSILVRLVAEGAAVPLNLFGSGTTDMPDFLCSPAVFSFLFTLRGNKAWKTAPVTSGPVRVSPLALNTYELLAGKVTLSAYDLTTHLGKEITEAATLRALSELWQQLRVLPVPQADGSAAMWELATARFTKQIKAGANAGQPTALSALISLYLQQSIAATEDEVETFLSPLAPRSRVRSILHDLMAARQLETIVVEGKTMLHVSGELPAFAKHKPSDAVEETPGEADSGAGEESRIRKFKADPAASLGRGLKVRPAFGKKFGGATAGGGERQRRPFDRAAGRPDRPANSSFDKPWQERRPQPSSEESQPAASDGGNATFTPASRPSFRDRPAFGQRREGSAPAKRFGGGFRPPSGRPATPRGDSDGRPERPRRSFGEAGESRPFQRQGSGDFNREGRAPRRDFSAGEGRAPRRDFASGEGRPPRRDFAAGEGRPPRRDFAAGQGRPPRRDFNASAGSGGFAGSARPGRFGDGGSRPPRRTPEGGGFPPRDGEAPRRSFRPAGAGGDRPPFQRKPQGGDRGDFAPRPKFGDRAGGRPAFGQRPGPYSGPPRSQDGESSSARPVYRKFDAPRGGKPFGAGRNAAGSGARSFGAEGRPGPGSKRPFSGKGGSFSGSAGGKKPFSKGPKPAGGFTPVRRKRPDEEA